MDADEDFGLNGFCGTSIGVLLACGVAGALVGMVALVAAFVCWTLVEDGHERDAVEKMGPLGRPWG